MERFSRLRRYAPILVLLFLWLAPRCADARVTFQYPAKVPLGSPFLVRLTSDETLSSAEVVWQGRTIPLELRSWNGKEVGLGLLGTQVGKVAPHDHGLRVRVATPKGTKERMLFIKVLPRKYQEEHLSLPDHMVVPPKEVIQRIRQERKITTAALTIMTRERLWELPIRRPVDGIVTSPYGRRRILNGHPKAPHGGMDFRAARGTEVQAALSGRVVLTGDHYYAGKSVYVDSGGRVISHYFHLDSIDVKEGDRVTAGQIIGKSGMTGRSTGPHLHFGISIGGQMVNPEPLFSATVQEMMKEATATSILRRGR